MSAFRILCLVAAAIACAPVFSSAAGRKAGALTSPQAVGFERLDDAARSRIGALESLGRSERMLAVSRWNQFAHVLSESQRRHDLEDGVAWRVELTRFTGTRVLPRAEWRLVLTSGGADTPFTPTFPAIVTELLGASSPGPIIEWTQRRAIRPWVRTVRLAGRDGSFMVVGVELVREDDGDRSEFSPKQLGFGQVLQRQGGQLTHVPGLTNFVIDSVASTAFGDELRTRGAFLGIDVASPDCPVAWEPFLIAGPPIALLSPSSDESEWRSTITDPGICDRARASAKKGDSFAAATAFACGRIRGTIPPSRPVVEPLGRFPSACSSGPWIERWVRGDVLGREKTAPAPTP